MAITKLDKDSTRAERKAKKRKIEDSIPHLPGDVAATEAQDISIAVIEDRGNNSKKRKLGKSTGKGASYSVYLKQDEEKRVREGNKKGKEKGSRAGKNGEVQVEETGRSNDKGPDRDLSGECRSGNLANTKGKSEVQNGNLGDSIVPMNMEQPTKKSKKERKAERKAAEAAASNTSAPLPIEDMFIASGKEAQPGKPKKNNRNREKKRNSVNGNEASGKAEGKKSRFIVFIGNLPFSATTESIKKHFAAVHPKSIRHLTEKDDPKKSKGCAFLEFEGYDHMKACLKSFHHSTFDNGVSAPRKINVELSAGGGGNKQNRHAKISEKNLKLTGERIRRMHEEDKAKLVKKDLAVDHNDVHPSRRARVLSTS